MFELYGIISCIFLQISLAFLGLVLFYFTAIRLAFIDACIWQPRVYMEYLHKSQWKISSTANNYIVIIDDGGWHFLKMIIDGISINTLYEVLLGYYYHQDNKN